MILDRSADPVLVKSDVTERTRATHRTEIQQYHVPSGDPSEHDPHAQWNLMVSKAIFRVLLSAYPGHFWEVVVDREKGIATITIPLLLGNWKYLFKLSEDIQPADIIRAGGEILERFNIPRSPLNIADFINAKKLAVSRASQIPPGGLHRAAF